MRSWTPYNGARPASIAFRFRRPRRARSGEVKHTGEGKGTLTLDGSPTNAFGIIVEITGQGTLNTAAFKVSIDGGYSYSDETTVPLTGEYTLEGTGLKLTFAAASEPDDAATSFKVGDVFTASTTAPTMTNGDVIAAIEKLHNFAEEYEFIHIVGESSLCALAGRKRGAA